MEVASTFADEFDFLLLQRAIILEVLVLFEAFGGSRIAATMLNSLNDSQELYTTRHV